MANKQPETESPFAAFSTESTRQRWELFHRAISYAKESNNAALNEAEPLPADTESSGPLLSVVR